MKPVLKYPGAKWNLAEWIISFLPSHTTYLEPFFGSGAVFFNKRPSEIETINDISGGIVNLFRTIRDNPKEIAALVYMTPWARAEYEGSYKMTGEPLEDARLFLIRCWQAHASDTSKEVGWRSMIKKSGGSRVHLWNRLPERILATAERLRQAQIEHGAAVEIIKRYNTESVLIYADPPYPIKTRTGGLYAHEMTDADHIELLDALDAHPGSVILSGYACDLYDNRLKHWRRETKTAQAEKGQSRTEVLWINPVAANQLEGRLF